MDALQVSEQKSLTELEAVIEANAKGFIETGRALAAIRDQKLYRAEFSTFEDYCQTRWQFTRQRAYLLIESASVVTSLSTSVDKTGQTNGVVLPDNEAQARALAEFPAEDHAAVMAEAAAEAPKDSRGKPKVSARVIRNAGNTKSKPKREKKPKGEKRQPKNGREIKTLAGRAKEIEEQFGKLNKLYYAFNEAAGGKHGVAFRQANNTLKKTAWDAWAAYLKAVL